MKIKRQAGKYDLDVTPMLWTLFVIGIFAGWLLSVAIPWLWNVIKPWLHTISGG